MTRDDSLHRTLDALREAALTGKFDEFPALCGRLQAGIDRFDGDAPENIAAVHAQANALMLLLEASAQGLKAARDRLSEIARIRQGGGTYGDKGQRQQLALPNGDSRKL